MSIPFKRLIVLFSLSLFFCSNQEQQSNSQSLELSFDVDSTKIGSFVENTDFGFSFGTPKGWTKIPDALFAEFSKQTPGVQVNGSQFVCSPVAIFLNKDNQSLLYISHIQAADDSIAINSYQRMIQARFSTAKTGDFINNNIRFRQFLIQDEMRINFKLLFFNSKNRLFQFDYIVPKKFYVPELKAIESSIGSIKLIN